MPTILELFGVRYYFYSLEHLPIHIHITNADGKAKINIQEGIEVVENMGIKPKDLKKALKVIEAYREDFIKMWHEYHDKEEE